VEFRVRIVSLLPSATEILGSLGLENHLVGVTHECDFPPSIRSLPKVTRTLIPTEATSREIDGLVRERLSTRRALYSLDFERLEELQPDLLVTQALCDVCAVAEEEVARAACRLPGQPRVLNLEPTSLDEVLECIEQVGAATGVAARSAQVVTELRSRVEAVIRRSAMRAHSPRVVLLEWIDPPFSSGHWSPELVRLAGGREGIGREGERSRQVDWSEIVAWDPEVLVVACCGYTTARTEQDLPILQSYPGFADLSCTRRGQVYLTDGNAYFSRPGPRLVDSLELLAHILDPAVHPLPAGVIRPVRCHSGVDPCQSQQANR